MLSDIIIHKTQESLFVQKATKINIQEFKESMNHQPLQMILKNMSDSTDTRRKHSGLIKIINTFLCDKLIFSFIFKSLYKL